MEIRKIIHIDMDAFYASVEQRDFPAYRGRPVIVGGAPDKRGVVAACSYEARKFGIHSAMPSSRAYRLCPKAIFVSPRFDIYRQVAEEIQEIFRSYTIFVEPLSLDEAYLDVTDCELYQGSATKTAMAIKKNILKKTGLTASAGVSYNKFLAKVASDMDKPDGLFVITPDQGEDFIATLAIGKFFGIGKATEARMKAFGINNGADLKRKSMQELKSSFGKTGTYFFNIARGIDNRPVKTNRIRKSVGSEQTFEHDLSNKEKMLTHLRGLADKVSRRLKEKELFGKTITIKVKYADFEQITRSVSLDEATNDHHVMVKVIPSLLQKTEAGGRKVRLLGVTASNLIRDKESPRSGQIELL